MRQNMLILWLRSVRVSAPSACSGVGTFENLTLMEPFGKKMKVLGMGRGVVGPSRILTFSCIPPPFISPPSLSPIEEGRPQICAHLLRGEFQVS